MAVPLSVLFIDDSVDDVELLIIQLRRAGYRLEWQQVSNEQDLRGALAKREWDVVLCDFVMPGFSGSHALSIVRSIDAAMPFIFVSGAIGEDTAVEAMQGGAHDYVMKNNLKRLIPAIDRSLRDAMVKRDRNRMHRRLDFLAHHDPLTGLANRVLFLDRLRHAINMCKRHGCRVAIAFIDLDRFKLINDTLGHAAGDQMLRGVAARLQENVRNVDTVARLSGDEFAVILPDMESTDDIARVMNKINIEFAAPFEIDGGRIYSNLSIGVAVYPSDGAEPSDLLRCADIAMYRSKQEGRGYQFYTAALTDQAKERLRIETGLRQALDADAFVVYYQPLVNAHDNRVEGVEALVRLPTETGMEMPSVFIPLAEKTGLIVPIGDRVLAHACKACSAWRHSGYGGMRVAVNLSVRQFQDPHLPAKIQSVLDMAELNPGALELEITESVLMEHDAVTKEVLRRLHDMGVTMSIDDFGTGYSSLGYLRQLPIDVLKIDQSFTRNLSQNRDDRAIIKAIINLARCLNIKVTAEGVESLDQLEILREEGCDTVQGFYYSKPMSTADVEPWLHQRAALPLSATAASR